MNEEGQTQCFDNIQTVSSDGWRSLATAQPAVVVVWGGGAYNVGEAGITRWLHDDKRRLSLREFYFHPAATKNGAFPRPLYFEDDRNGKVCFPVCKIIGMAARAAAWATPLGWGWEVPTLEQVDIYASSDPFDFAACVGHIYKDHPGVKRVRLLRVTRSKPWPGDAEVLEEHIY